MRLERTNIRSILGLRFRDAATEQPVTDRLDVTVRRKDDLGSPVSATRTVSGAYVAQRLPGLRAYERSGTSVSERSVPFLVSVEDPRGHYVPVLLRVDLPYTPKKGNHGLYPIAEMSDENGGGKVEPTCYLFRSVNRPVGPGQAVVYADLEEKGGSKPAAHAVLKVQRSPTDPGSAGDNSDAEDADGSKGEVWYGVADTRGRVAVQFPVPPVRLEELNGSSERSGNSGNASPSSGGSRSDGENNGTTIESGSTNGAGRSLSTRTWELEVGVRYEPDIQTEPAGAKRPLLSSILNQGSGSLYDKPDTPTLTYGEPLILRADGRSTLRVIPHSA